RMASTLYPSLRSRDCFLPGLPLVRGCRLECRKHWNSATHHTRAITWVIPVVSDFLTCPKCGLQLPGSSSVCECGFVIEERSALDDLRRQRSYRNLFLIANAFMALGIGVILSAVIRLVALDGLAQGLSGVCGAWAFWSL